MRNTWTEFLGIDCPVPTYAAHSIVHHVSQLTAAGGLSHTNPTLFLNASCQFKEQTRCFSFNKNAVRISNQRTTFGSCKLYPLTTASVLDVRSPDEFCGESSRPNFILHRISYHTHRNCQALFFGKFTGLINFLTNGRVCICVIASIRCHCASQWECF